MIFQTNKIHKIHNSDETYFQIHASKKNKMLKNNLYIIK